MGHGTRLHNYSTLRCLVQYRGPRGRFLATSGRNDPYRCRWKARTRGSLSDFWIGGFHRIPSKVEVANCNFDDVLRRYPGIRSALGPRSPREGFGVGSKLRWRAVRKLVV